jgi:putative flippase GtrA
MKAPKTVIIFLKAQISASIGGIVDYLSMIFFTEFLDIHYTISIVIGGMIGAIVNFSLNKRWTFRSKNNAYKNTIQTQLLKCLLVVLNSIILKVLGTYYVTDYLGIDYKISRLGVDLFVSLMINFLLQKYWVFRKTIN